MSDLELLNRVKNKDRDAFVELMKKYGEKLYAKLLENLGDRRLADAAFKETMIGFYKSLTENDGDDAISSLLSGYAETVSSRMQIDYLEDIIEKTADCAENSEFGRLGLPVPKVKEVEAENIIDQIHDSDISDNPTISRSGWFLAVTTLSVCALIVLWIIIGLLCSMDVLPNINLGYEWFNNNVAEWF